MPKNVADVRVFGSDGRPSAVKPMLMSLPVIGSVVETALAVTAGSAAISSRSRR